MTKLRSHFHRLRRCANGATAVEYGLIVAAISITLLVALSMIGTGVNDTFTTVGTTLSAGQSN